MKSLAKQLVTLEAIADDPSFHHFLVKDSLFSLEK